MSFTVSVFFTRRENKNFVKYIWISQSKLAMLYPSCFIKSLYFQNSAFRSCCVKRDFNGYNYVKKQGAHKAFIWKIIRFPQREVLNIHEGNTNVV